MLNKERITQIKKANNIDISALLLERQAREEFKQDKDPVVFWIYETFEFQDYDLVEFVCYSFVMLFATAFFYKLPHLIVYINTLLGGVA